MLGSQALASSSDGVIIAEGPLGGYAWGENVGWVDFSKVSIDNHGYFSGSAYGENIGWLTFNKDEANNVLTDWRPRSARAIRHSSSGSSSASIAVFQAEQQALQTPPAENPLSSPNTPLNLSRTLKLTTPLMRGDDVKSLQVFLNTHGFALALTGIGSLGKETLFFGKLTKASVIKFQLANQLIGDGIVGPLTQAKLKL